MNVYYVTHPNIDLSAKVTAPNTEKARTAFLDYLERVGKLRRSKRGYLRENMVAEKLSDSFSIDADVELGYGAVGGQSPQRASSFDEVLEDVETPRRNDVVYQEPEDSFDEPSPEPEQRKEPAPISPIAQMSLGGFV